LTVENKIDSRFFLKQPFTVQYSMNYLTLSSAGRNV